MNLLNSQIYCNIYTVHIYARIYTVNSSIVRLQDLKLLLSIVHVLRVRIFNNKSINIFSIIKNYKAFTCPDMFSTRILRRA